MRGIADDEPLRDGLVECLRDDDEAEPRGADASPHASLAALREHAADYLLDVGAGELLQPLRPVCGAQRVQRVAVAGNRGRAEVPLTGQPLVEPAVHCDDGRRDVLAAAHRVRCPVPQRARVGEATNGPRELLAASTRQGLTVVHDPVAGDRSVAADDLPDTAVLRRFEPAAAHLESPSLRRVRFCGGGR
ncbi:MAG: hypothetical protein ABJB98_04430 [Actinomycetota bacterium]